MCSTNGSDLGKCDYLVVGAGAASIAFIDTILTEQPEATVVLVDRRGAPGGHWVDAYDFVRLHQPSLLYGVSSEQLEGDWMKLIIGKRTLPWNHRASKKEILTYFKRIVNKWVGEGRVRYFPRCDYTFGQDGKEDIHVFSEMEGNKKSYSVKVECKLVNGVLGECKIPSLCPVDFPVEEGIKLITPNELFGSHTKNVSQATKKKKQYIVLGCGKTAMDTVVYLQSEMRVHHDDIAWVVPNDVWMMNRGGSDGPWSYPQALLQFGGDREKALAWLEEKGSFVRLDKNVQPTKFRFPVIGADELKLMRKVKNVIRRGRVSSISLDENKKNVSVNFGPEHDPLKMSLAKGDRIFVHCTSPGPFNGNKVKEVFVSEKEMNLLFLYAPPVSISMSCLAKVESARRKGTLDVEFGRELLQKRSLLDSRDPADDFISENDVLKNLITAYNPQAETPSHPLQPIINLALFFSLIDANPNVGYEWMQGNRLSFFAIPNFKGHVYENLIEMKEKKKQLGYSESDESMFALVAEKLEPLKGR